MLCNCDPPHDHPPEKVTYSRKNRQAKLFHCPKVHCSNKDKSVRRTEDTKFPWVETSVDVAKSCRPKNPFRPCNICFNL